MLRPACFTFFVLALGFGCAQGSSIADDGEASGPAGSGGDGGQAAATSTSSGSTSSAGNGGSGGSGGSLVAQSCPTDQIATGVVDGQLVCSDVDQAVHDAVNDGCSVYFGWRDGCGGCTDAPSKWGSVGASTCANGLGVNGTCTTPSLGGTSVQLFGLNMDGDVNDDDKLYLGLQCDPGSAEAAPAPCGPGEFVSGLGGGGVTCMPASGAILDYVRESCSVYFGWRDSCDGCTSAPAKYGRASSTDCSAGLGVGNTCTTPTLGGQNTQLFGLSVGGDVDGNDKIYVGLRCAQPTPATTTATGSCPPGQLVTGVEADGTIACVSPAPLVAGYFKGHCALYMGWNDSCDGCTTAPGKWGHVRDGACTNGLGGDSTCQSVVLGADTVNLFGLNTDGDVGDDDKLYFGFRCD